MVKMTPFLWYIFTYLQWASVFAKCYICQKGIKIPHLLSESGPTEILYYGNMKGVWDVTGLFVHWAEHYASSV